MHLSIIAAITSIDNGLVLNDKWIKPGQLKDSGEHERLFFLGLLWLPGHDPPLVPVYEHAAAAAVRVAHVEVVLVAAAGLTLAQNLNTEYQILALQYNKI